MNLNIPTTLTKTKKLALKGGRLQTIAIITTQSYSSFHKELKGNPMVTTVETIILDPHEDQEFSFERTSRIT